MEIKDCKTRIWLVVVISWPFLLAASVFLIVRFAIKNSTIVDLYYSKGFYPFIAKMFSGFSNLVPFSLWDSFWFLFIILLITGLILVVLRKMKFVRYLLRVGQLLALLYAFFYFVWGFNYFRPKIETRVNWEKPKADKLVFKSILDSIIANTNSSYISVYTSDYPAIDSLVEDSYRINSEKLGIAYPNGTRRPKIMLFSLFFAKSGVSGYFGPFFNEIHLNYYLLPFEYPFILAHEKAHQFGITNEAEANLVAFVICTLSGDQKLEYSAYINLLVYFLSDASKLKDVSDFIKKIDKPVIMDLRFQRKHWQGLQNVTLNKVQTAANNAYLKTNNIEEGVMNYNQVVALVISWYQNSNSNSSKQH